jgi:hypothetical protein
MTETTNVYPDPKDATPSGMTADRVARLVTELGVGWAKYGITIGRLALEQSAKTLHKTSDLLGVLAARVEKAAAPKDETVVADAEVVAPTPAADETDKA